ncbi:hypothetical protein [Aquariibacter albus]|nr:hypothetical protein [Aquariibacter albus]
MVQPARLCGAGSPPVLRGRDPLQRLWRRVLRQHHFQLLEEGGEPGWTVDRLETALVALAPAELPEDNPVTARWRRKLPR